MVYSREKMAGENILEDDKKINICFVAPVPPPYGGIANWTSMVCRYLERTCPEVVHYTVINTAPRQRVTEGRTIWNRVVGGGLDMLCHRRKLRKLLHGKHIDAVHITTSGSLSVIRDWMLSRVAKRYGAAIIYHIHFGRIPELKKNNSFQWKVIRKIVGMANYVIAIDKSTYHALWDNYGQKIRYIPNPIDLRDMPVRNEHPQKVVMYLGWVIKEKGIEELLQAWENIYPDNKEWKLEIVGPYKKEYLDYLQNRYITDGVEFLGEKSHAQAMDLLNASSIFVLPSYTEGCPYVIMEAMALGKIIIGTNVGNIPEMLGDGCGYVVAKKNVDMLQIALKNVMADNVNVNTGDYAREKVKESYEIGAVIHAYQVMWVR